MYMSGAPMMSVDGSVEEKGESIRTQNDHLQSWKGERRGWKRPRNLCPSRELNGTFRKDLWGINKSFLRLSKRPSLFFPNWGLGTLTDETDAHEREGVPGIDL